MGKGRCSRRFLLRSALHVLCCSALVPGSIAWAQDTQPVALSVGDTLVRGDKLQPFKNQWHMSVTTAEGKVLEDAGTWTDEMVAVTVEGRACWKRVQVATYKAKNGEVRATSKTVNTFDRRTLAPVYREFEKRVAGNENTRVKISFREKSLKIESTFQTAQQCTRQAVPRELASRHHGSGRWRTQSDRPLRNRSTCDIGGVFGNGESVSSWRLPGTASLRRQMLRWWKSRCQRTGTAVATTSRTRH